MKKKMYAPGLDRWIMCYSNANPFSGTDLVESSQKALKRVLKELSHIGFTAREGYWDMWLPVERGTLEDFGDYERLYEEGDYGSFEEFENDWKRSYPNEVYWHKLVVAHENDCTILYIDNSPFVNIQPQNFEKGKITDVTRVLNYICEELRKIRKHLEEDTYEEYLKKNLPYEYQFGLINRGELWAIEPKRKEIDIKDLTTEEIDKFTEFVSMYGQDEPLDRLSDLTAERYYELCAICYKAAKFKELEGRTPKEMYRRYGDNRDGGLSTLDQKSSVAFREWFESSNDEKWKIQNASHLWELSTGSTPVRMHLRVDKDEKGYYLTLSGGWNCRTAETVRMYNALCDEGIPLRFFDGQELVSKIHGRDDVGVVPITEIAFSFWYGGFPKGNPGSFIQLDEYEKRDEIVKATAWFELPTLKLKE